MKKNLLFLAVMYVVALFATTSPASAQNQNNEYREILKKIMVLSGASATTENIVPQILSMMKKTSPATDDSYWNEIATTWGKKIEDKVLEVYIPIYQRYLTLDDLKKVVAFYESPTGQKLGKTTPVIMSEAMPIMQQLGMEMAMELMPKQEKLKATPVNSTVSKSGKSDQQIFDEAYVIPEDSIEISNTAYQRGMGTKPSLYSIEKRKKDTRVTFLVPIYFDSQWLHFSPGFKIVDKKSGDEYNVRGYDGGAPFGRLLTVKNCNNKCIFVSLLFPKLKKDVKAIDILELPHEKDVLPTNDDGVAKSYLNVKVEDYLASSKKSKKVYN